MQPSPATTTSAPHGDAHAEPHHPHPKYFNIWFILLVVTVLEVIVGTTALPKSIRNPALCIMALYKAVLVALYFMHLKFERRTMWVIASAPLIFGVILAIGTFPDSEKGTTPFKRGDPQPWLEQGGEKHE
jgi:cytochrome c oxidase subunit 4